MYKSLHVTPYCVFARVRERWISSSSATLFLEATWRSWSICRNTDCYETASIAIPVTGITARCRRKVQWRVLCFVVLGVRRSSCCPLIHSSMELIFQWSRCLLCSTSGAARLASPRPPTILKSPCRLFSSGTNTFKTSAPGNSCIQMWYLAGPARLCRSTRVSWWRRRDQQRWVFGIYDPTEKSGYIQLVEKCDADILLPIIQCVVASVFLKPIV